MSIISTIIVLAALAAMLVNAPGWDHFKAFFFDPEVFASSWPKVLQAFLVNVRMFLVAEFFVLICGLLLAIMRGLPGPVFTPFRGFAIIYVDVFRGLPAILVVYVLGFGIPGLGIEGVPTDEFFWGVLSLVLLYSAYVSEVYRAGIESVHPSQEAAARSLGLTTFQALRFVVVPQAVRRVIPPLLNDFIGLQKDTALVGLLGLVEAFRRADIEAAGLQLHTVRGHGHPFPAPDDPALTLRRLAGRPATDGARWRVPMTANACPPAATGASGPTLGGEAVRIEGLHKSFGGLEVLKGIDLVVAEHEVVCLIGASGSGKSTLLRCVNLLEPIDAGRVVVEGQEITASGTDVDRIRRRIGIVFQAYNLFPHMSVLDNITLAPRKVLKWTGGGANQAMDLLERFGLTEKARPVPRPPLGWPAAACGHRPCPGHEAGPAAARRDHVSARSGAGGRGARRHP